MQTQEKLSPLVILGMIWANKGPLRTNLNKYRYWIKEVKALIPAQLLEIWAGHGGYQGELNLQNGNAELWGESLLEEKKLFHDSACLECILYFKSVSITQEVNL